MNRVSAEAGWTVSGSQPRSSPISCLCNKLDFHRVPPNEKEGDVFLLLANM